MRHDRLLKPIILLGLLVLTIELLPLHTADAVILGYVDGDGHWHFPCSETEKGSHLYSESSRKNGDEFIQAYQHTISRASEIYNVKSGLIKAVIKAESDFDRRAMSSKGAVGLMQLMPQTAREMEVGNPFNPAENILGGTRYLALQLRRFGHNMGLALAAFNAGPERVEACGGIPAIKETRDFVKRVLYYYHLFQREGE